MWFEHADYLAESSGWSVSCHWVELVSSGTEASNELCRDTLIV